MFVMKVHSFISHIDCNVETQADGCVINVICYYHQYLVMIILEVNLEYSPEEGWGLSEAQRGRIRGKYKRKRKETRVSKASRNLGKREVQKGERGPWPVPPKDASGRRQDLLTGSAPGSPGHFRRNSCSSRGAKSWAGRLGGAKGKAGREGDGRESRGWKLRES